VELNPWFRWYAARTFLPFSGVDDVIAPFLLAVLVSTPLGSTAHTQAIPRVRPVKTFTNVALRRPIQILSRPDEANNLYVLEQPGRIVVLDSSKPNATEPAVFMDLHETTRMKNNEEGLLSMAFSPTVAEDDTFYLYFSKSDPRRTVLSKFSIKDGVGDPTSEEVLLEIPQPWGNHNGGAVVFGPDGMLYLSIGDGGAANDPRGAGQNLSTMLATVIRIDPSTASDTKPYSIPSDNPFVDVEGAKPEIWAYGLRNVWRMSFDEKTGQLIGGDVGQNKWEEIDVITRGGNYGWNLREGKHRFSRSKVEPHSPPIDPVVEYPRSDGISVTGGHVYRGKAKPELEGVYLYADYRSGRIWGIRIDESGALSDGPTQVAQLRGSLISSFGVDANGELWLCSFDGEEYPGDGEVWRFTAPAIKDGGG
jgi:glucose/arabinose dehydrogenase